MKKRILSIVLSIVMLVGLLPTTALAVEDYSAWSDGETLFDGTYDLGGETITITGPLVIAGTVTVQNGTIQRGSDYYGGEMFFVNAGKSLTLEGVTIDGGAFWCGAVDNVLKRGTTNIGATNSSELIYVGMESTAVLTNCVLQNNECSDSGGGGAISVDSKGSLTATNTTMCNNAKTEGQAGAIKAYTGATVTLTGCELYGNEAVAHGGAIQIWGGNSSGNIVHMTMTDCTVRNNKAGGVGGGIAVSDYSDFIMIGGTITDNATSDSSKRGGGVGFSDKNTSMSISGDAVISGNVANADVNNLYVGTNDCNKLAVGTMGGSANVGVTMASAGVFSTGGASYVAQFTSDNVGYKVSANGSNLQLVAASTTTYTVTYKSSANSQTLGSVTVAAGEYTLPACTFTPPADKQFAGWAYAADGAVISNAAITVSADTTLYAIWEDAPALPHAHDMSVACGGSGVTYTAWDGTGNTLGEENETTNVYLSETLTAHDSTLTVTGTVNLCLNGHSITSSADYAIEVSDGAVLNLCDCKGSGTVSGDDVGIYNKGGTVNLYGGTVSGTGQYGYGIDNSNSSQIDSASTVNLYGGTVNGGYVGIYNYYVDSTVNILSGTVNNGIGNLTGSDLNISGGTVNGLVYNNEGSTINISDGTVNGVINIADGNVTVSGGAIDAIFSCSGDAFTLSGAPTIKGDWGEYAASGLTGDIFLTESSVITIGVGGLSNTEPYTVNTEDPVPTESSPVTITSGWAAMGDAEVSDYFVSEVDDYIVRPNNSGELELAVKPPHSHSWTYTANGATITATCGGDSECDFSGNTTITIVKPTLTKYQGSGSENATIKDGKTSIGGIDTLPAIVYEKRDGTDLGTTSPTLPGDYKASITVGSATASVEYTIGKKSSSFYDNIDGDYTISDITHNSFKVTIEDVHGLRSLPLEYAVEDDIDGNNYTAATLDENYCFTVTVDDELIGEYIEFGLRVKAPDEYTEPGAMDTEMVQLLDVPVPTTYTVTVTNGTGNGDYAEGASVTITANAPETGKQFKEWTGVDGLTFTSGSATTATAIFTMPAEAVTVTATYEDIAVTTYTVTVTNDGNGTASASPTSGAEGTEITLTATPDSGYQLKEWQVVSGGITVTDNKFTMPASNVEIVAVFEVNTFTVSGTVQDNEMGTATVKLMQGDSVIKTTTASLTGSDSIYTGTYSFTDVAPGVYNIVVTKDDVTMTVLVTITDANVTVDTITMPAGKVNSKLEVKDEGGVVTPDVVVDGLQTEAEAVKTENGAAIEVTVTMTVQAEAVSASDQEQTAIKNAAPSGATIEYLDITVKKTVVGGSNAGTSNISETSSVLEIVVPYDFNGKENVTVYRKHLSEAAAPLSKLNSEPGSPADGTFFLDEQNGRIHIYARKFSTYAIGYTNSGSSQPIQPPTTGGGDYTPTYAITVEDAENGEVKANRSYAASGTTVTITATPEDGYILGKLTVKDEQGNNIVVTDKGDGTYTFKMPSRKVTVEASFVVGGSFSVCPKDNTCPIWPYTDAETTAWYHDGVHYCIENGLMTGYGNGIFKPNADTTRAMITVMLWRLNGSPVVNYLLDFEDVEEGQWYTEAIRWAKSEGIATGYGNGCFGTNDAITREQMVTILWRYAQYKGIDVSVGEDTNILSYNDAFDVAEYAIPAMQWACGSGMVQGMNDPNGEGMILAPESKGTRAQIATMMMRFCTEIVK